MAKQIEMVVIDGVRYRPEDVPEGRTPDEAKAARAPRNKARTAPNKAKAPAGDKAPGSDAEKPQTEQGQGEGSEEA